MAIFSSRLACWTVGLVAVVVYLVTLPGDFTFDDTFAIVRELAASILRLKQLVVGLK
jgi:hypothetical protein